jgi:hypothetical protein
MPSTQAVAIAEARNAPMRLKENRKIGPSAVTDDRLDWCVLVGNPSIAVARGI